MRDCRGVDARVICNRRGVGLGCVGMGTGDQVGPRQAGRRRPPSVRASPRSWCAHSRHRCGRRHRRNDALLEPSRPLRQNRDSRTAAVATSRYRREMGIDAWYTTFAPPAGWSSLLCCSWTALPSGVHRLTPDGCTDLLRLSDGTIVLCGPERASWRFRVREGTTAVGVRLRPGAAHVIFGLDVSTIADRRVALAELVGIDLVTRIGESIGATTDLDVQRLMLVDHVIRLARSRAALDHRLSGFIEAVLNTLVERPRVPQRQLAAAAHVSVRSLHRSSLRVFGYGTSTLARIVRFQRLLALATVRDGRSSLADLAAVVGYSDHAHLIRDCRAITSLTPTTFFAEHFPTFPDSADPYKTNVPLVTMMVR